jgi:hypothetical protein
VPGLRVRRNEEFSSSGAHVDSRLARRAQAARRGTALHLAVRAPRREAVRVCAVERVRLERKRARRRGARPPHIRHCAHICRFARPWSRNERRSALLVCVHPRVLGCGCGRIRVGPGWKSRRGEDAGSGWWRVARVALRAQMGRAEHELERGREADGRMGVERERPEVRICVLRPRSR